MSIAISIISILDMSWYNDTYNTVYLDSYYFERYFNINKPYKLSNLNLIALVDVFKEEL